MDLKKFAEELANMSAKEVQELAETLKKVYGIEIHKVELVDREKDMIFVSKPERREKNRDVIKAQNIRYQKQKGTYCKGHVHRYNMRKNHC